MQKGKILVVDDEVYILHILDFSLGADRILSFDIPSLAYWDLVLIEWMD